MKRTSIIVLLVLALILSSCQGSPKEQVIKVGASPVPHAQILEKAAEILAADNIKLEVVVYNDYIIPNTALAEKELDANFFQHIPYLEEMSAEKDLKLTWTVKVHIEPLGLYSSKLSKLEELPEKAKISIPNDATNGSRALKLLAKHGLITLDDKPIVSTTDIKDNPKALEFILMDAAQLPRTLEDVDASVINTNYVLQAELKPEDALIREDGDSPYANVLAVREDNKEDDLIKKLSEVLQSEEIRQFIEEEYKGAIVPAF